MKPCGQRAARAIAVVALACVPAFMPAYAASFDCAKAATRIEKSICADPSLGKLDADIAAAYVAAGTDLDAAMRQRLLRSQRDWLAHRQAGKKLAEDMKSRLALLHATRTTIDGVAFLKLADASRPMFVLGTAPGAAAYDDWADGVWSDAHGDTSYEDARKAREQCAAHAADDAADDCVIESQTREYQTSVPAPGMVSVREWISRDVDAAHPMNEVHHHNWWLSRSGRIVAADMFAGEAYKAAIARALRAGVRRQCDVTLEGAADGIDEVDSWGLSDKGMTLTEDGESVQCGRGEIDVDIPWRDFGVALRPEFAAALRLR